MSVQQLPSCSPALSGATASLHRCKSRVDLCACPGDLYAADGAFHFAPDAAHHCRVNFLHRCASQPDLMRTLSLDAKLARHPSNASTCLPDDALSLAESRSTTSCASEGSLMIGEDVVSVRFGANFVKSYANSPRGADWSLLITDNTVSVALDVDSRVLLSVQSCGD